MPEVDKSMLDFPLITTATDSSKMYVTEGTGTDRDKHISKADFLKEDRARLTTNESDILSNNDNNINRLASLSVRNWLPVNSVTGQLMQDVTFSESLGLFVAVGRLATNNIQHSTTGEVWTPLSITDGEWRGIAFSESLSLFVAVGSATTNNLAYSSTGLSGSWTVASITDGEWRDVTFSESLGLFVAVGIAATNNIAYSSDGTNWSYVSITDGDWQDVTFSESLSLFVAVGFLSTNNIAYSSDGVSWNVITIPGTTDGRGIAFSESLSLFVVVFGATTNNLAYSSTGLSGSWTVISTDMFNPTGVTFSEELQRFVAVGYGGNGAGVNIVYSSDGTNWLSHETATAPLFEDVVYAQSLLRFVTVGSLGINPNIYTTL